MNITLNVNIEISPEEAIELLKLTGEDIEKIVDDNVGEEDNFVVDLCDKN